MKDQEFISYFGVVLAVLVALTVFVFVVARVIAEGTQTMDHAMLVAVDERTQPVGVVNVGTVAVAKATSVAAKAAMSPAAVYQSACQACHLSGILESPKLDDKAAWQARAATGLNTLYESAIKGKGSMPPKGGRVDLSDDTIKQVVDYMLKQAGVSAK